ncbi:MAG: beta-glucosidase BglX [Verrucomicrobiota bacterium]
MLFACSTAASAADNSREPIDKRVEALLARMTLEEKVGQMCQVPSTHGPLSEDLRKSVRAGRVGSMLNETNPAIATELQRIAVEESRLHIPLIMGRDVIHGFRTIFPIPLAQASTWDPDLAAACASVAAGEARGAGYQWTFAPMMDVTRDPRWGRVAEGFGEDPYLASRMAAAMVRGFQGASLASTNSVAACAKHFAGYGAVEGGRDYDTASIPEGLLRDVYLPPFRAAVDAGVATVMTSFNEINGVPSSGNSFLLRQVLRNEWGFRGFVVSDWESMIEMIDHGFCPDARDVALKSITAGVDMEMTSTAYASNLQALVESGAVPQKLVDDAVRRILRIKFMLGFFDDPASYRAGAVGAPSAEARALARRAAREGMVLLKNPDHLLPLSRRLGSVALIGPLADEPYEVLGTWNREGRPEETVTPLDALRELSAGTFQVNYAAGLPYTRSHDTNGFAAAVEAARKSDVVIAVVGEESILSGEAHSRARLDLPGAQPELVRALAATGKPLVLVVMAGRPLVLPEEIDRARAVLYAWHGGTMTGPAMADLLFGIESPSGKLPITFPRTEGQIPVYYAHKNTGRPPATRALKTTSLDDIPVHAYQGSLGDAARYLDIGFNPQFPFGFGLSYTEFRYLNLRVLPEQPGLSDTVRVVVDLANTGEREAVEIAQIYVGDRVASLTRPVKELKGFQKVRLKPGETRTLTFELPVARLGFYNAQMKYAVEPGIFDVWVGSDSDSGVQTAFEVVNK